MLGTFFFLYVTDQCRKMKIIEGTFAGKQIQYKEQKWTRVTTDKVRKAVFDVLKGLIGGPSAHSRSLGTEFSGMKILDLFCGSGMYGMESLSRGAGNVLFLDNNRSILKQLEENLSQLKVESYKVEGRDYDRFIKSCDEKFDLVFADPPYYEFDFSKLNNIYSILNKEGIFVLESSKRVEVGRLQGLELIVEKKYGDARVLFYKKL